MLAERATLFEDMLVLVTQHGLVHAARRVFDPPASPITVLPGTPVRGPRAAAGNASEAPRSVSGTGPDAGPDAAPRRQLRATPPAR